jgi:hypothetical protein
VYPAEFCLKNMRHADCKASFHYKSLALREMTAADLQEIQTGDLIRRPPVSARRG